MTFAKSPFGDNVDIGSGGNVNGFTSNHYGTRASGGEEGVVKTEGVMNEATVNFDSAGPIYTEIFIPEGAVVRDVAGYKLTGSVGVATVGAQDIIAARADDDATWVTISASAVLTVTGPTAGTAVVTYANVV